MSSDHSSSNSMSPESSTDVKRSSWSDVSSIRQKLFIPDEYKIIVPGPNDKIDDPPERCLAFHVASLEAGLRFPLSRHVEDILSGFNVCPSQLMPNSYRHILSFVVLARHFQVDPSFVHLCNLMRIVTKIGDEGFFYLAPKSNCKLLCDIPSWLGSWKNKFIYVMSPGNKPWRVPIRWNNNYVDIRNHVRIKGLESPSWGRDFISNKLTVTFYESSKILKEDVLVLAGLSPAPIETTQSLEMAVRAAMLAKAMREHKDALMSQSQLVIREPSKEKDSRCGRLSKRARAEVLLGEEVPTEDWVEKAEKIVGDKRKQHDGSSSIIGDNAIFKPREDILEKYKQTLRDDDQLALGDLPLTKLEDIAAYHSLAINGVMHHLLLRAAYSKNELLSYQARLKDLEQSLNDNKHEKMSLQKRLEELKMNRDRESMEYRLALKRTREEVVKDFVKSNTYEMLVAKRAATYSYDGFEKCRAQAKKLGAFRREFDTCRLDPFKDGDLKDPVFEDEVGPEEDEFGYLLQLPD
ncbi:hypothetical protein CASFOL_002112 [Castilleja foliolosa]|uniref:Transposase (putative) gypsy type domain-containing protein n=1 Tax=Castilleja foliolosa TaxID=1961234 RepID=A0ABD3EDH7_9LAMI